MIDKDLGKIVHIIEKGNDSDVPIPIEDMKLIYEFLKSGIDYSEIVRKMKVKGVLNE